jgi:aminoglycoside phosphotransferase (APT) family kinase protein
MGGAPIPPVLIDRIDVTFDRPVAPGNGYGLTETTSAVVANSGSDYLSRPDSVGRCQPGTDVRVVDPASGEDATDGDVGELWFRGPNIVRGYWNNPEATAAAFADGWFRTGDLGRVADGWVYVVDRMKDVIIRGGENIYCVEVEAALFEHPAIEEAAVVGVPHSSLGEEAVAVVVPGQGTNVTAGDVQRHVAERLASFKVPARVVFQSEPLPRTASGKVLKRDLRSVIAAKMRAGAAVCRPVRHLPVAEPKLAGIDAERVRPWLADHVEGLAGPVEFELLSGGHSNLTYRLTDAAGTVYALRRPPLGGLLSTAHDMSREWRFICALAPTPVPVAPPLAYCADTEITGAEFYVMGFVEGLVLADRDAGLRLPPGSRARAGDQVVDVLVALHALDPVEIGLGELVRRTGYLERQLRRWHAQVHASGVGDLSLLDEVHDLLARRIPAQRTGIVHGDYRPGNLAFGPDGAVRAVFDWELATSGDPMADLGWLAASWQDPEDEVPPTTLGPGTAPGFPARARLMERYARLSGRDVSNLPYWVAFSRWRAACIGVGVRARYLAGYMADDGYLAQARARADEGVRLTEAARDTLREMGI